MNVRAYGRRDEGVKGRSSRSSIVHPGYSRPQPRRAAIELRTVNRLRRNRNDLPGPRACDAHVLDGTGVRDEEAKQRHLTPSNIALTQQASLRVNPKLDDRLGLAAPACTA